MRFYISALVWLLLTVPPAHAGLWESEIGASTGGSTGEWGASTEITLSAGGIATLTGQGSYTIDTNADGATDDMVQILGLAVGDEVIVAPDNDARTVVVKNGVNLILCRETDFIMNNTGDRMILQGLGAGVVVELSRSSGGD